MLRVADQRIRAALVVLDESEDVLDFVAEEETEFVLGTAIAHPHDLVLGYYSVHTFDEALQRGEQTIMAMGGFQPGFSSLCNYRYMSGAGQAKPKTPFL